MGSLCDYQGVVMMLTFYVLKDDAVPGAVKVGRDTAWPSGFNQAQYHTPGNITVPALFQLPVMDLAVQEYLDSLIKSALYPDALNTSCNDNGVQEWYSLDAYSAVSKIRKIPEFADAKISSNVLSLLPLTRLGDDD